MTTINADGPKYPIVYPIGIIKTPYPIDADIIKFAVFEGEDLNPYYIGTVKNRANIEAKNIPIKKTPRYATAL
jgi:hypothetical protein